jgi:outer membrane protein
MINFKQFQFLTSFLLVVFVLSTASFAQDTSQVLSLEDCINIALEKNSTLRVSRFSDEAANKDVLGSYSGILPTISVSANKGNRISGPAEYLGDVQVDTNETGGAIYDQRVITAPRTEREYNSASLSIDQNIFDGGIWWNKIRKAKTDKESSKFNLLGQLNDVVLQVQQAYFNLNKQIKLLEVYEVAVTRSQAQLDRTEKMYELGATAQLDVFQARVNLGNDRILLLQQKNTLDQAKKDLNLVMGQDPFTPLQISTDINLKTDIQDSEELIQIALENHPTIKQDEANIKSNGLSVSLAKGSYYPRLYGYVDYQRSNEDLSRVYKNYDKNYTVTYGVGLSLNIFKGFSDYVSVQKAKIAEKTAKENFEAYRRNLASEIEQYYADYKSYLDIIEINKQNLDAAKEEMRLAEERYQIGAGTALEVREAQVNLTRAEEILIAAQFNARIVLAQLENGLGMTYKKYAE